MENFQDMDIFQDMEVLLKKSVEIHVVIQYMENFQDMEIILDMEVKHHTLYCTTISRIKQLFHETYKLYACALH